MQRVPWLSWPAHGPQDVGVVRIRHDEVAAGQLSQRRARVHLLAPSQVIRGKAMTLAAMTLAAWSAELSWKTYTCIDD
jgi:hypothetical protein